jgi:DNA polymerase III subunit epsilon
MWPKLPGRKSMPVDAGRWLVLDVESSGLDASSDRLLALAAVALRTTAGARGST